MFTFEPLPAYSANLDDILHVGNASDAAPDSFVAQENFLTQLEKESKKLGRANDDDLLDALDQSLFTIYKGDVADWEPLTSSLESPGIEREANSLKHNDIATDGLKVKASLRITDDNANRVVNKQSAGRGTRKRKLNKTTKETKPKARGRPPKNSSASVVTTRASWKKACLNASAQQVNTAKESKNKNIAKASTNIKPVQVAVVGLPSASLQNENTLHGIAAPDADSLLDLLEEKTRENFNPSNHKGLNSGVTSSTKQQKPRRTISINPVHLKKQNQSCYRASKASNPLKTGIEATIGTFPHLTDHNYCLMSSTQEGAGNKPAAEVKETTVEVETSKVLPPSACKVVKWQDYLQRVRLGIRSAPNSPSTSPKIPRGAARKVNNFMVIEGSKKQSEIVTTLPTQAPKPPSPLLDPLTAVKIQTKTKTPIQLQEFEDYLANLEKVQSTSPTESTLSTTSPPSSENSPPVSATPTSNDQLSSEDKTVSTDESSCDSNKSVITVHVSPHTRNSVENACESITEMEPSTATDPRNAIYGKKNPCTILQLVRPAYGSDKSDKQVKIAPKTAPSFKLVSAGKGASSKSLILSNVTGQLEEILSSLAKQQKQQAPLQSNPAATAQQQETLLQLLAAISNLQSQEVSAGNVTSQQKTPVETDVPLTSSQAINQVKKAAPVPSPLSLIHEIKQNMSKKTKSESEKAEFMRRHVDSAHALQRVKHRKSSRDSAEKQSPSMPLSSSPADPSFIYPLKADHTSCKDSNQNVEENTKTQSKALYPNPSSLTCTEGMPIAGSDSALPYIVSTASANEVVAASDTTVSALSPLKSCSYPIPVIISQNTTATPPEELNIDDSENALENPSQFHNCTTSGEDVSTSNCQTISNLQENSMSEIASLTQENQNASSNPTGVPEFHEKCNDNEESNVEEKSPVICDDVDTGGADQNEEEDQEEPESGYVARRLAHQHGLFGVQQNRGLKFTSEVRAPLEEEVYSDSLSLDEKSIDPRVYESDDSTKSYERKESRKKNKKRKHRHKKHKKKHHRHHRHHRRRSDRHQEEEYHSDSSVKERRWKNRKRRVSEDTYSSARLSSSDSERDVSPPPKRQRRRSRNSYSPRQKRSRYSSVSRSRSRSPRRMWKYERREYQSHDRYSRSRASLSPASSVERSDRYEQTSNYEWDYLSRRRIDTRETKDQAIRERRVMYVGRIARNTTKFFLRQRFRKFGQIDNVELYFRRQKDSYAFVTFHHTRDAYDAIEHGNDGDVSTKFDLCFGGRRQFCQMEYADLDEEGKIEMDVEDEEDDFDTLLRKAMKR